MQEMKWSRFINKVCMTVSLLVLSFLIYCVTCFLMIYFYGEKDEAREADVALILGAATYNGVVSDAYQERINHGIELYNEGYVKKILVTGGVAEGNYMSDAESARDYIEEKGVDPEDILMEEKSGTTMENLVYGKEVMEKYGYTSAVLVSDPIHMKRAVTMAKDLGIKAYSSPTRTGVYKSFGKRMEFAARETYGYVGYQLYKVWKKIKF